jgi:hypothetical protein
MTEAEILPTVILGVLGACSLMFTTGVAAVAKLYSDVRAVVAKQNTDMEFVQKQLDMCHNEKEKIYLKLVELGIKLQ